MLLTADCAYYDRTWVAVPAFASPEHPDLRLRLQLYPGAQGQARVPGTLDRNCTASAGVSLSQLSFVRQASFDCPAPLDSHARAHGYMPILRVVERWCLCLAPLGLYKAFGHENHLAHGSPEKPPSSTSPIYSPVLVRVIILIGILTGIRMYKYQRLQGSQGNACSSKSLSLIHI